MGNKTFCGRNFLYPKTDWLQRLSCRAKNEKLFLNPNQEMLKFKYLHQNCMCAQLHCQLILLLGQECTLTSQPGFCWVWNSDTLAGGKKTWSNQFHCLYVPELADFSECDGPAPQIFISCNGLHFIFPNFQTRNKTRKVLIATTTTKYP